MNHAAAHDHAMHHDMDNVNKMAVSATLHCLTGCAIGEILGLMIGTAIGLSTGWTIVLAVSLAFFFGYLLSTLPLVKAGLGLFGALSIVFAADTLSIATMELVDNGVMALLPGAMDAGLVNVVFWIGMLIALTAAFFAAYPVNRYLLKRGKGHALTHHYHHDVAPVTGMRQYIPNFSTPVLLTAILAFMFGGLVVATADQLSSDHGMTTAAASQASIDSHNDADMMFAQMMVPHHKQAVDMTKLAASRAQSPEVKQLAATIEAAQQPEIDKMSGLINKWGGTIGTIDHSGHDPMLGMFSYQAIDDLADTSGAAFDRAFMTMMIEHHEGAMVMAQDELDKGKNAEALALAATIHVTQAAEVSHMRQLLN